MTWRPVTAGASRFSDSGSIGAERLPGALPQWLSRRTRDVLARHPHRCASVPDSHRVPYSTKWNRLAPRGYLASLRPDQEAFAPEGAALHGARTGAHVPSGGRPVTGVCCRRRVRGPAERHDDGITVGDFARVSRNFPKGRPKNLGARRVTGGGTHLGASDKARGNVVPETHLIDPHPSRGGLRPSGNLTVPSAGASRIRLRHRYHGHGRWSRGVVEPRGKCARGRRRGVTCVPLPAEER